MRLVHTNEEEINSKDKKFIEDLKEISILNGKSFIMFDKKDVILKKDIDEVEMEKLKQEFYSKVDVKINDKIKCMKIIKILNQVPKHLGLRLEADYLGEIIELMKSKILIEKLEEQKIKFVYKGIEIEPRIIKSKMDEDD